MIITPAELEAATDELLPYLSLSTIEAVLSDLGDAYEYASYGETRKIVRLSEAFQNEYERRTYI